MTDFQVLPPGLNAVPHNRLSVDPKDFQIKRKWLIEKQLWLSLSILTSFFLFITEPVDEFFADRDLPAFLPPEEFSKFDKPSVLV